MPERDWWIRPLREEDIPRVATFHRALMPPGEGWGKEQWRFEREHPLRFPFVAETFGELIGVASFWDEGDAFYLATLLVVPEHRRKGIGRALIREGKALAQRLGRSRITLHVRSDNITAHRFYTALGFSLTVPSEIRYPDGTPGDRWEKDVGAEG